ncbi:ATP-binding mismatch repair protein [Neofusicoccum ribis]|uniref:ATP-binding mismatch repair protein n=1 Tax=Neofusicoccum ribis TaxID=45134 RepID=A0ABR3SL69_9PEZI
MATIKAIEGRSVHQIQSGQVIIDLCSVVKELVENSLDAGATSIGSPDVRFKNHGLDSIEVQDNGHGIAPDDYETIALKHYTSKLSTYDDLSSLQTFGFRGEALSSLCALSHFHILTARASDGPKGTRLDFEPSGKLKGTSVVASQKGTTVAVENLFYNLPVRRRELDKNIKREYGKVLGLLHAKKTAVFSTKPNPTTRENIANVYGAKTLLALIPLNLTLEMTPTTGGTQNTKNWSTQDDASSREVRIQGHISRPVFGEGRQTPDRQMFFVNSRPCALPQVSKAVNEVYKSYNVTQSPFIFANLVMDTGAYDVNVSPDKRTILLHDQTALLEALKGALIQLFEEHDQTVPQAQLGAKKLPQFKPLNFVRNSSTASPARDSDSAGDAPDARSDDEESNARSSSPNTQDRGGQSTSLIQKFVDRDSTSRSQLQAQAPARQKSDEVPKEKQKLARFLAKGDKEDCGQRTSEESSDTKGDLWCTPQIPAIPRAVQDFNDRIASQEAKTAHKRLQEPSSRTSEGDEQEPSISIIKTSSQKNSPGPIQNAFDRMRPKRAPTETATITIGNKTTTMTIGTPEAKRRRIHTPKYDLKGGMLPSPGKNSGFVSSLRLFTAPGMDMAGTENDEIEDDEADSEVESQDERNAAESAEEPDSSAPDQTKEGSSDVEMAESGDDASDRDAEEALASAEEKDSDEAVPEEDEAGAGDGENAEQLPREDSPLFVQQDEDSDEEYLDEDEKKAREETRVAEIIAKAEETATRPTQDNLKRATNILKGNAKRASTLQLVQHLETSVLKIERTLTQLGERLQAYTREAEEDGEFSSSRTDQTPEERLSLTVSKSDFGRMRIIGQFNLGFILAVRPASSTLSTTQKPTQAPTPPAATSHADELFIIDQHASDEKINFERLTNTTILAPQRLVHPHTLDLTAIEEEIILSHPSAFAANGFQLTTDTSGDAPVGKRCSLLGLPVSKETTFTVSDLEELVALLSESSLSPEKESSIPRPSKVRKMLAMRACRSSIMIGKTLTKRQMEKVVREMGDIDKPWNCPHGRPTMRHLATLGDWEGWKEGDGIVGLEEERREVKADWAAFVKGDRNGPK